MSNKMITKADYSKLQHDADWGEEPYPDLVEKWINLVAKDCNLDKNRVNIWYCHPEEEYCIYVDKKWVGYFDVDSYFSGGHWSGYDKFENGKGEKYEVS